MRTEDDVTYRREAKDVKNVLVLNSCRREFIHE
jgi:hypothetical protein